MANKARKLWQLTEPIHALTYFAPEAAQAFLDAGLRGFWRGYFAGRAAPFGEVVAPPVTAAFYGFQHEFVARAVPGVWELVSPAQALLARTQGATASLRKIGEASRTSDDDFGRLGELLRPAVTAAAADHRPLGLANALLPWPTDAVDQVWHACTVIREHRGDGHVASLIAAELDPCESSTLRCALAGQDISLVASTRGWSPEDWDSARQRLVSRGLLADEGGLHPTEAGSSLAALVESGTDHLAFGPLAALEAHLPEIESLAQPIITEIATSGLVPFPNPIGVDRAN